MKTPDEIKKAASLCILSECCEACPYYNDVSCSTMLMLDVFACIEQIESRVEPKNRVLTLEELKNHAGFLWNENRYDSFESEGEPAYAEKDFLYVGDGNVDLRRDISDTYGKNWRCWLRKPTPKEMEATPWEA